MSITLQKLMSHIQHKYELTCMTGTNGMSGKVNWIYYMEDIEILDFSRGGEIVITTGMNCKDEQWFLILMEQAAKCKVSAVIINVGYYIKQIPDSAIEFANKKKIPIFAMPWHMHIVDLTQDICNLILLERQKEFDVEKNFSAYFFKGEPLNRPLLEEHGLFQNFEFCILKGAWNKTERQKKGENTYLENYLADRLDQVCHWYVTVCKEKSVFVFLQLKKDRENSEKTLEVIKQQLGKKDKTNKFKWGIGTVKQTFDEIEEAKEEAEEALFVAAMKNETAVAYKDLGFYQILLKVKNKKVLKNIYQEKLGFLNQLPEEERQMYLETLRSYIECNGSIQKVAEKKFLHRNTVNYRMKKLKEMLPVSLENEQEKFMLWASFYIGDILKKGEK